MAQMEISSEEYSAELHNSYAAIVGRAVDDAAKLRAVNNHLNQQLEQARETIQSLSTRVAELEAKVNK